MKSNANIDLGLLIIRIALGAVFLTHGIVKLVEINNPIGLWFNFVALVEVLGAISMLLGIATGWAGILLALQMLASALFVQFSNVPIANFTFDLELFLSAIAISFTGPGAYSLKLNSKKKE